MAETENWDAWKEGCEDGWANGGLARSGMVSEDEKKGG